MANHLAPTRVRTPHCTFFTQKPLSWIKRRARRLALAYAIERHEAVAAAALDWAHFNPTATH